MNPYRPTLNKLLERRHLAVTQVRVEKQAAEDAAAEIAAVAEAQATAQTVAQEVQNLAHARIAGVVTRCLATVFEEDAYEFHIDFARKRGRTEAQLQFLRNGNVVDPTGGAGCGQVDVAAMALRLSALMLTRPQVRRLLCLDEPLRNVHGERYQSRVAGMVEGLADEMGIQFILITDDPWLKIGHVVEMG